MSEKNNDLNEKKITKSLSKILYGDSKEVNSINYNDYNNYIKNKESKQTLSGFDENYLDIVDYIVKITHRIWEEKGIGLIYDTYHNDIKLHSGSITINGINEVISGTLQTLYSFPDRKLRAQDVIWADYDNKGYITSHRIMSKATNLNSSTFGPATGRKVNFRTTVDCIVHNNKIHKEYLVRDNLAIVEQLGFDPYEVAKKLASKSKKRYSQNSFGIGENTKGQIFPEKYKAKDDSIGEFVLEICNQIYENRLINKVKDYYRENATVNYICNETLVGHSQIQGMLIGLFASFPNANYNIDQIICNKRKVDDGWNVSVRWRIWGIHEGNGYFGSPSGKEVEILGINHYHIINRKIVEEWITFDGLDVLRQIFLNKNHGDDKFEENESS